MTTYYLNK